MNNNIIIINIDMFKLRKLLTNEDYRQKEVMKRKQYLYDYDYKRFLERSESTGNE
ncbi:hypothetical protein [Robertmurraya siralis]|uniref:hypothetical protein n=1 Tax=Robertmurraya siralis TaxID=77777 RepID=UPI001476FB3C|nr:hypothetical protein [Robertmurraya siralis]